MPSRVSEAFSLDFSGGWSIFSWRVRLAVVPLAAIFTFTGRIRDTLINSGWYSSVT
jgi:hypothetical protein